MKKKALLILLAVLCIAAAAWKAVYDRQQKETFVDQWVATGEAMAEAYRTEGIDGYQVRSGNLFNMNHVVLLSPYYDTAVPDHGARIPGQVSIPRLPADAESDQAVQALIDSMTLVWIRDEVIPTTFGSDFFGVDTPRLILTQQGQSREFALTLEEDRGLLTQANRVDTGVGLFLEYSVDRSAAQYLLDRVTPN